jgi:hypothetical protein
MKLTEKDKTFLETLKQLMESKELSVELKPDRPSRMVLRGTYGERIHKAFRMTRQGVRWRFWRLFNDIYVSAFETILFVEKTFGTQFRDHAIRISKERWARRQEATQVGFTSADALQQNEEGSRQEKPRPDGEE